MLPYQATTPSYLLLMVVAGAQHPVSILGIALVSEHPQRGPARISHEWVLDDRNCPPQRLMDGLVQAANVSRAGETIVISTPGRTPGGMMMASARAVCSSNAIDALIHQPAECAELTVGRGAGEEHGTLLPTASPQWGCMAAALSQRGVRLVLEHGGAVGCAQPLLAEMRRIFQATPSLRWSDGDEASSLIAHHLAGMGGGEHGGELGGPITSGGGTSPTVDNNAENGLQTVVRTAAIGATDASGKVDVTHVTAPGLIVL